MSKSMSREHADLLKRCYMSTEMDHDSAQSQRQAAYDLLAHIYHEVLRLQQPDMTARDVSPAHSANS